MQYFRMITIEKEGAEEAVQAAHMSSCFSSFFCFTSCPLSCTLYTARYNTLSSLNTCQYCCSRGMIMHNLWSFLYMFAVKTIAIHA